MKLHSNNIAKMAGALNDQIEDISQQMINEANISVSRAKDIIETINKTNKQHNN
jgi:hydroxymethylglutaryl-CoA reductase